MFLSKPVRVVRHRNPLLSDSSIRRLVRQRIISQRCRNQDTGLEGPMRRTRLALRGQHRFPIELSFLKHPKTGLREMACHRHLGPVVAAPSFDPLIKPADMMVATALAIENRAISGFHKGPLQIHVDIAAYRSVVKLAAAGVLARYQAAVARQLLSTIEALDTADLGPNHHRQDLAHPGQALEPRSLRTRGKSADHVRFDGFEILHDVVQLIEHVLEGLAGMGRKLGQQFLDDLTAALAKGIAHLVHDISVLTQGRMHAIFKLGSLLAEHHASARQLTSIANRTRRDPHRRQGSCSLQSVHSFRIQLVALIHAAHHQFCQSRVNQLRLAASGLDLIDHPVPVPHGLHGHQRAGRPATNKVLDCPVSMGQPILVELFAFGVLHPCPGVVLMNIECNVFHNAPPSRSLIPTTAVTVYIAFIIIRNTSLFLKEGPFLPLCLQAWRPNNLWEQTLLTHYLGRHLSREICSLAGELKLSPFETAMEQSVTNLEIEQGVNLLLRDLRGVQLLRDKNPKEVAEIVWAIVEKRGFIVDTRELKGLLRLINRFQNLGEIVEHIEKLQVLSAASKQRRLHLSTIHRAKGLEHRAVILLGCVEGAFPLEINDAVNIPEERRLAYVALTRAKDFFVAISPETLYGEPTVPSRFVKEMGLKRCEWVKCTQ